MKGILVRVGIVATLLMAFLAPAAVQDQLVQASGPPATHIVVFQEGVDPDIATPDLARAYGLTINNTYRYALKGAAAVVPPGRLAALRNDPRVRFVEADQEVQIFDQTVPTGIERIFANGNPNVAIDGVDDYRIDVDVAVIDTGIDFDHPDLNVVARADCSGGGPINSNCKNGAGDDGNGHGSHVAGTIGALDNGIGVVGVAPGARLWAVKVLKDDGSGWISSVIAGVDWVTARAGQIEVANMSLGCECSSGALNEAISNSVNAGVVYAVAAGNNDKDAATFSPANHPDVITVSALADFDGAAGGLGSPTCRPDQDDTLADFSNWGNKIEVAAPGVCILSTWKNGGYNTISGTSMASPHVAGAAALLASGANDPKSKQDVNNIRQTIINNGNFNWTDDSGDGIKEPLLDVSNTTVFNPARVAVSGGGGGANTAPTAQNKTATTNQDTAVPVVLAGADAEQCELTFSIVGGPSQGSLSAISNSACASGSPNTDSAAVTYTPNASFNGSDSFTYKVNDGALDSNIATVSITVNPPSSGNANDMYVWDIAFQSRSRGKGGAMHDERIAVTGRRDSDADSVAEATDEVVPGASVTLELTGPVGGTFSGTTDGNGVFLIDWLRDLPDGTYVAEVSGLTHSTYSWNKNLDPTANDADVDLDNLPDQQHTNPH